MSDSSGCGGLLIGAAIVGAAFWWYENHGGRWTGWIYPDRDQLEVSVQLGEFKDFEACQVAAIAALRSLGRAEEGNFECGRRCRADAQYGGLSVCKETRK